MSIIEKKVSVIFELIQNHQPEMPNMHSPMQFVPQNMEKENDEEHFEQHVNHNNKNKDMNFCKNNANNLIEISDNNNDSDSEYEGSDDSLEISDNEYENENENKNSKLFLDNAENINLGEEIKKINIPLERPNKFFLSNPSPLEEVNVTDSLDSVVDDSDLNIPENNKNDNNKFDNNKLEVEEMEEMEEMEEEEEEEEEEINKLEESNNQLDPRNLFDYNKLRVPELKALAEEKGLSNYKSLKKSPLIELLKSLE